MGALRLREHHQLANRIYYDFDSLGRALEDLHEERALDIATSELPLSDELTPFRGERVTCFVGSPGGFGACPACGLGCGRVDGWGAFACESCGFTNVEERPLPRHHTRRIRSLH